MLSQKPNKYINHDSSVSLTLFQSLIPLHKPIALPPSIDHLTRQSVEFALAISFVIDKLPNKYFSVDQFNLSSTVPGIRQQLPFVELPVFIELVKI